MSIYKDIFLEKTKNFIAADWIEIIYQIPKASNRLYEYYEYCADYNVKIIIEAMYNRESFYALLHIIIVYNLPDAHIISQIAESKISEIDNPNYTSLNNLAICGILKIY
jgi:hypothetical protein